MGAAHIGPPSNHKERMMTEETQAPAPVEPDIDLKAELLVKAEKLGVTVDKRWGVARIEAAIADHAKADPVSPPKPQVSPPHEPPPPVVAEPEPVIVDGVKCRVTKAGHEKIFTGKADPLHYRWNDMIVLPRSVADQLESRNYVEIGEP